MFRICSCTETQPCKLIVEQLICVQLVGIELINFALQRGICAHPSSTNTNAIVC